MYCHSGKPKWRDCFFSWPPGGQLLFWRATSIKYPVQPIYTHVDSITLPEFWVWKPTESGPAEIARKVGNLPEFWVWKLPEIKASFFAAALKKQGIFSCYCKALSPICCSYKCCSACYIDSIQKLSLLQLLLKKNMTPSNIQCPY